MNDLVLIVALLALLVAAMVLGAAEAALLRVPRVRVAVASADGDAVAGRVLGLVDDLPVVMNTILLVVLLVQIGAATVTGVLAARHFGGVGVTVASIVLTLLLFVYAEAIPKTYAVRHPFPVARAVARPVGWLVTILRPVVSLLVAFADLQAPGKGVTSGASAVSEEELLWLAEEAERSGSIDPSDRELLERGFALGDRRLREIVVPRIDIVAVDAEAPARRALEVAIEAGHRRLPVHRGDLDDILGVVRLRDLAAAVAAGSSSTASELADDVLFVPETNRVVDVLGEMQRTGLHMAVAVDEHGGTEGIATIEDVVSELVGTISDEGELRPEPIREIGEDGWDVDATTEIGMLEAVLGVEVPHGDSVTVGGFVTDLAGAIPAEGASVTSVGFRFTVTAASGRRIETVTVERVEE